MWVRIAAVIGVFGFLFWRNRFILARLKKSHPALLTTTSPDGIYDRPATGRFYAPVNISIDPMEKLALVNLAKGADPYYDGFELQTFDHETKGTGALFIAYRLDGLVDVYYHPTLTLDKTMFAVGAGLGEWVEADFAHRLAVTEAGLDLYARLTDARGCEIEITVKETKSKGKSFDLLAPLGSSIETPRFFPFFYLRKFDLVRRGGTKVSITIDGKPKKAAAIPMPLLHTRSFVYFARYSPAPIIGRWNMPAETLKPLAPGRAGIFKDGDTIYTLEDNDGHHEIAHIASAVQGHKISLNFTPPIPNIAALRDGAWVEGCFSAGVDEHRDVLGGDYRIRREDDRVHVYMHPTEDWKPKVRPLLRLTLKFFPPVFWTWPKDYEWSASIDLSSHGDELPIKARWNRIG
jgi:hypothetical protein